MEGKVKRGKEHEGKEDLNHTYKKAEEDEK